MQKILISLFSFVILLSGCQSSNIQEKDTEEVADVFNDLQPFQEDGGFHSGINNQEITDNISYTYDGRELKIPYFIENTDTKDLVIGVMIFVDGIPQKYSYDEDNDKAYVKTVTVKSQERVNLFLYFSPSIGKKGETKGLSIQTIFNPNFKATINNPIYGNNHSITSTLPINLIFNENVKSTPLKTKEYKSEDEYQSDGFENSLDEMKDLSLSITGNTSVYYKENGLYKIPFEMKDGGNTHYKVFAYIDHEVVPIDGLDYLGVTMSESKSFIHEATIDADLVKDSSSFYLVAITDGDDYSSESATLSKSDSVLLVNEVK